MPQKRQTEVQIGQDKTILAACREAGISDKSYYRYWKEYGGLDVARGINGLGVLETMAKVMMVRGVPEHIRLDNGTKMTSKVVQEWLAKMGAQTLYIEPGSPWENGYRESLNS